MVVQSDTSPIAGTWKVTFPGIPPPPGNAGQKEKPLEPTGGLCLLQVCNSDFYPDSLAGLCRTNALFILCVAVTVYVCVCLWIIFLWL